MMQRTETIALRVFLASMLCCAVLFIIGIWLGGPDKPDSELPHGLMQSMQTFFVVGFASFLIWATTIIYRFLDAREKK